MRNFFLNIFSFVVIFMIAGIQLSVAEPVSINKGKGQGFLFTHNGNCFVILPSHVHGRSRNITLATAAPTAFGDATILSFSSEQDLSIGYVSPGLEKRCTDKWSDLPDNITARLGRIENATLKRVSSSGLEERIEMRIVSNNLDNISAKVIDGNEIFQGTSGGILMDRDVVIGMAIKSPDNQNAIFLRMDEIKSELGRLIDAQANIAKNKPISKGTSSICLASKVKIKSVSCDKEPFSTEYVCSNLANGLPVVFFAGDFPIIIDVEFEGKDSVVVSEITLISKSNEGEFSVPKGVRISIDSSTNGNPRWRNFGSGDMPPLGKLQLSNGTKPFARRNQIQISSSWAMDRPTRIDCLSIR